MVLAGGLNQNLHQITAPIKNPFGELSNIVIRKNVSETAKFAGGLLDFLSMSRYRFDELLHKVFSDRGKNSPSETVKRQFLRRRKNFLRHTVSVAEF